MDVLPLRLPPLCRLLGIPSECEQEVTAPLQAVTSGTVTLKLTYVGLAEASSVQGP